MDIKSVKLKLSMKKSNKDNRIDSIIAAIFIFCFVYFCLLCCDKAQAQNVTLKGKTFTEQKDTTVRPKAKQTDYVFVDKDGQAYPIWVSSKGKYFIVKVSKKTGKEYRKYLPQITEMLAKK